MILCKSGPRVQMRSENMPKIRLSHTRTDFTAADVNGYKTLT